MADSEAVIDELCDFLACALHLVLYARRVYPREIFERRRHLDVTVFRSRHVELNEYLALIVQGARQLMERGEADTLVVTIRAGYDVVLERFRFDLSYDGRAVALDVLREHLRGFLLKLLVCDSMLGPLPSTARLDFTAELHTKPSRVAQPLPDSCEERKLSNRTLLSHLHSHSTCALARCIVAVQAAARFRREQSERAWHHASWHRTGRRAPEIAQRRRPNARPQCVRRCARGRDWPPHALNLDHCTVLQPVQNATFVECTV